MNVGQRVFVDWPETRDGHGRKVRAFRQYGQIRTARDLNIPQDNGEEQFVLWSRGKGFVHLNLLEAEAQFNGTTITPIVRTYTRPYVGKLKPEYMTPKGAGMVNGILLSRNMPSLCMKGVGKTPNIRCVPSCEWQVFRSAKPPTEEDYFFFSLIVGPFKTSRAAYYMAEHGGHTGNPHCITVSDAERLAEQLKRAV